MANISSAQLERVLSFAGGLAELDEFAQLPQRVPQLLRSLIACDHAGHNVISLEMGRSVVVADPADAVFSGGPELLSQFAEQNPLIVQARAGTSAHFDCPTTSPLRHSIARTSTTTSTKL